jgi:hypothetical protein
MYNLIENCFQADECNIGSLNKFICENLGNFLQDNISYANKIQNCLSIYGREKSEKSCGLLREYILH